MSCPLPNPHPASSRKIGGRPNDNPSTMSEKYKLPCGTFGTNVGLGPKLPKQSAARRNYLPCLRARAPDNRSCIAGSANYFPGMSTAFDTAATVRELEATGMMDRG